MNGKPNRDPIEIWKRFKLSGLGFRHEWETQ